MAVRMRPGAAVLIGAEINSVLENAAAEAGEPGAKQKGEKAANQKAAGSPITGASAD